MKSITLTHRVAGLLTAATLASAVAAGPAQAGVIQPPVSVVTDLTVAANSAGANGHWQDTGLLFTDKLIIGQVTATGSSKVSANSPIINPNGLPGPVCSAYQSATDPCLDSSAPLGALLGRIGNTGTPFVIGTSHAISGTGELELAYNDLVGAYADNTGSYCVTVDQFLGQL